VNVLRGIRVIDLSRMLPAGALTQLLADMGSDVIKVERPGTGDETRAYGAPVAGTSAAHAWQDRGKRSIALDLKDPDALEVVRRLVRDADAVVESFRPGVADRLGVGYEQLRKVNPRIVYCSVNGYGTGGPREQRPGHDLNYLAYAGVTGFGGSRAHGPALAGVQSADIIGGLVGAVGLLGALVERQGRHVEVALADAALWAIGLHVSSYLAGGPSGPESTAITGASASYRVYRCADGHHLTLGAVEPQFWAAAVTAVGRPDLVTRQQDPAAIAELEALFATRPRDDWMALLDAVDTCAAPVQEFSEIAADPQFAARGMLAPTPGAPDTRQVGTPIRFGGPPPAPAPAAPQVGRDTREILKGLGLTEEQFERASRWAPARTSQEKAMDRV
jgi:crotonobetainyl-CoA:carnitine CoA-transferase CaiB-like acyl-CoA transferase